MNTNLRVLRTLLGAVLVAAILWLGLWLVCILAPWGCHY